MDGKFEARMRRRGTSNRASLLPSRMSDNRIALNRERPNISFARAWERTQQKCDRGINRHSTRRRDLAVLCTGWETGTTVCAAPVPSKKEHRPWLLPVGHFC